LLVGVSIDGDDQWSVTAHVEGRVVDGRVGTPEKGGKRELTWAVSPAGTEGDANST
jgi:hypothetical protein